MTKSHTLLTQISEIHFSVSYGPFENPEKVEYFHRIKELIVSQLNRLERDFFLTPHFQQWFVATFNRRYEAFLWYKDYAYLDGLQRLALTKLQRDIHTHHGNN